MKSLKLALILDFLGFVYSEILDARIECNGAEITAYITFDRPFDGVVFAKGFYTNQACRVYGNGKAEAILRLPANQNSQQEPFCGIYNINQRTMAHVIISNMQNIIVDGSQELKFECQYELGPMTLRMPYGGLKVNWPALNEDSQVLISASHDSEFPDLHLMIRDGHGITGLPIRNAIVGQKMTLDVFFKTAKTDVFVYDCLAHDGNLLRENTNELPAMVTLIDSRGCVTINQAINEGRVSVHYDNEGYKHVYLPLYGFQFYTTSLVHFECQIKPCTGGPCPEPICDGNDVSIASLIEASTPVNPFTIDVNETSYNYKRSLDNRKTLVAVVNMGRQQRLRTRLDDPLIDENDYYKPPNGHVCLPIIWLIMCLSLVLIGCFMVSALLVMFCLKLRKERQMDELRFSSLSGLS